MTSDEYQISRAEEYEFAKHLIKKSEDFEWRQWGWQGYYFCCYFWFVSIYAISFGVHLHWRNPLNIEIHIPFGFIRFGLTSRRWREHMRDMDKCRKIVADYERDTELERI